MAGHIFELFGYSPHDQSPRAEAARTTLECPFLGGPCSKTLNDGILSGVCSVKPVTSGPVICCPVRLYAQGYMILQEIARQCFGAEPELVPGPFAAAAAKDRPVIAVFGKRWGRELHLPAVNRRGSYYVDWVLALLEPPGVLIDFAALEVQSIDTTGNYRDERAALVAGRPFDRTSTVGLNWENVNKRILPQLIYKGHVLRREPLCKKGLFFVSPEPVYHRIDDRLGNRLEEYHLQPGSITFKHYNLGAAVPDGSIRPLVPTGSYSTTVDQVALAFTMPAALPPPQVYESAIAAELLRR